MALGQTDSCTAISDTVTAAPGRAQQLGGHGDHDSVRQEAGAATAAGAMHLRSRVIPKSASSRQRGRAAGSSQYSGRQQTALSLDDRLDQSTLRSKLEEWLEYEPELDSSDLDQFFDKSIRGIEGDLLYSMRVGAQAWLADQALQQAKQARVSKQTASGCSQKAHSSLSTSREAR